MVVSFFALIKLLGLNSDNEFHLNVARSIFLIGHGILFIMFVKALSSVDASINTNEQKSVLRTSVRKMFKNIGIRAILIASVHYKTQMIPPLIISCVMGLFTVFESYEMMSIGADTSQKKK